MDVNTLQLTVLNPTLFLSVLSGIKCYQYAKFTISRDNIHVCCENVTRTVCCNVNIHASTYSIQTLTRTSFCLAPIELFQIIQSTNSDSVTLNINAKEPNI